MNRTPLARRTQIINCLVEGNSIRSTERMTDTHRDTIMRLMIEVGTGCAKVADEQMRDLNCRRIQCDEIWSFVKIKQGHIKKGTERTKIGDQWTFVAIDADTKACPGLSCRQAHPRQRHCVHERPFGAPEQPRSDFIGWPAFVC
jgi:hypothetical protein